MSCSDTEQATESPKPSGEVWQHPRSGTAPELGRHPPVRRGLCVYVVRQESREQSWAMKSCPRPRLKANFPSVPEQLLSLTSLAHLFAGTPAEDKSGPLASPQVSQGEGILPGNSGRCQAGGCNAHRLPKAAFPLARHRALHAPGWKPTPSLRHGTPTQKHRVRSPDDFQEITLV